VTELSRRNVLLGAGGVALAGLAGGAAAGYALADDGDPVTAPAAGAQTAADAGPPKYRSRPDLRFLPDVTITTPANGTTAGYIFLTPASGAGLWGPLIVDQKFSKPVVAATLSGGSRFFNGQRFSTYGTSSFYQPLFLFWDEIVANNPYVYAGNLPGQVGPFEHTFCPACGTASSTGPPGPSTGPYRPGASCCSTARCCSAGASRSI